jgi:hypothetical protein
MTAISSVRFTYSSDRDCSYDGTISQSYQKTNSEATRNCDVKRVSLTYKELMLGVQATTLSHCLFRRLLSTAISLR